MLDLRLAAPEDLRVLVELVIAAKGQDVTHLVDYDRARGFVDEGRRILARPLLEP